MVYMIYAVVVEDRHTDVQVFAFSTLEQAMKNARDEVEAIADGGVEIDERESLPGWPFCAYYGTEGDRISVFEITLDEDLS